MSLQAGITGLVGCFCWKIVLGFLRTVISEDL